MTRCLEHTGFMAVVNRWCQKRGGMCQNLYTTSKCDLDKHLTCHHYKPRYSYNHHYVPTMVHDKATKIVGPKFFLIGAFQVIGLSCIHFMATMNVMTKNIGDADGC